MRNRVATINNAYLHAKHNAKAMARPKEEKSGPTEQDRIAVKHLMDMPDLKWDKVEGDRFYMSRAQYDAGNDQL